MSLFRKPQAPAPTPEELRQMPVSEWQAHFPRSSTHLLEKILGRKKNPIKPLSSQTPTVSHEECEAAVTKLLRH